MAPATVVAKQRHSTATHILWLYSPIIQRGLRDPGSSAPLFIAAGVMGIAAGVDTAAGQSGFMLGIIISSALVTWFADQHFIQTLEQMNVPSEVIQKVTVAIQNVFAIAMSAGYDALPQSVESIVTAPFVPCFVVGLAQMFLDCGFNCRCGSNYFLWYVQRSERRSLCQ